MNEISVNTYVEARFQVRHDAFVFLLIYKVSYLIVIYFLIYNHLSKWYHIDVIFLLVQECITMIAFSHSGLQF